MEVLEMEDNLLLIIRTCLCELQATIHEVESINITTISRSINSYQWSLEMEGRLV